MAEAARSTGTSSPTRRKRSRRGEGDALREEILAAAEALLLEKGSGDAVSIRAIEQRVGVTAPTIYRHFADKDELMGEVCNEHFDTLEQVLRDATEDVDDPIDALLEAGRAYVAFGMENPGPYRIMFMTPGENDHDEGPQVVEVLGGAFAYLMELVDRAVESGRMRPDLDPFLIAVGLWTSVHGVTSLLVAKSQLPIIDTQVLIDHVLGPHVEGLLVHEG